MDLKRAREIGIRISEIRRSHGLTQDNLADILEVTPKHISHTESGTSSFSLSTLIKFCDTMECSLDYVVFGTSCDIALSRLPAEIIHILNAGNKKEIQRLCRYLELFIELKNE